jgi:hypothetical protein
MMRSIFVIFLFLLERNVAFQAAPHSTRNNAFSPSRYQSTQSFRSSPFCFSTLGDDDLDLDEQNFQESNNDSSLVQRLINGVPFIELFKSDKYKKLPPMQVEDLNLLFYDVFLIVNLTLSISFWVTHRMDFGFLPTALNEGCLLSILWIGSGLYHGAFLMSAVDGHFGFSDERGGPKAAAGLAVNTFINAVNLRLVFALGVAVLQHRQVGITPGEQLLPLEIGFGLILMTCWRGLHSSITPRI